MSFNSLELRYEGAMMALKRQADEIKTLKEELQRSCVSLMELNQENDMLANDIYDLIADNEEAQEAFNNLYKITKKLKEKNKSLKKSMETLENEIEDLNQSRLNAGDEDVENVKFQVKHKISALSREKQELEDVVKSVTWERDDIHDKYLSLVKRYDDITRELEEKNTLLYEFKKNSEATATEKELLEAKVRELEARVMELEAIRQKRTSAPSGIGGGFTNLMHDSSFFDKSREIPSMSSHPRSNSACTALIPSTLFSSMKSMIHPPVLTSYHKNDFRHKREKSLYLEEIVNNRTNEEIKTSDDFEASPGQLFGFLQSYSDNRPESGDQDSKTSSLENRLSLKESRGHESICSDGSADSSKTSLDYVDDFSTNYSQSKDQLEVGFNQAVRRSMLNESKIKLQSPEQNGLLIEWSDHKNPSNGPFNKFALPEVRSKTKSPTPRAA